jgi:hypothetical protein
MVGSAGCTGITVVGIGTVVVGGAAVVEVVELPEHAADTRATAQSATATAAFLVEPDRPLLRTGTPPHSS